MVFESERTPCFSNRNAIDKEQNLLTVPLQITTSLDRELICEPEIRPAREPATLRTAGIDAEELRQYLGYPEGSYPDPDDPYADDGPPSDDEYDSLSTGDSDSDHFNFDHFAPGPIEWQEPQVPPSDDAAITGIFVIQVLVAPTTASCGQLADLSRTPLLVSQSWVSSLRLPSSMTRNAATSHLHPKTGS